MNTDNTEELQNILTSVEDERKLRDYVKSIGGKYPVSFSEYMVKILEERGMSVADLQKRSRIDRTYIYQIMNGRRKPSKDKIIAMALGASMTFQECQRALKIAGEGILYSKSRRDSILIYALNNKLAVMDTNTLLEKYMLPALQ